MKTGIKIIACACLFAVALTLSVFTLAGFRPAPETYEPAVRQQTLSAMPRFTLGESDGLIAVYREGEASPLVITNIPLSSLREADRAMVTGGVLSGSEDELLKLLEDFGS